MKIVTGLSDGWGWGSYDHVSDSDLIKTEFYCFQEGIFPEIVQRLTPYLMNISEQSKITTQQADIGFIGAFKQFVNALVLLGKHIHPNLFYDKKLKMMKIIEQRAQMLAKQMQPFEKFIANQYLKPSIQQASDKFAVFIGPYELQQGKRIKLSGFFGTKEEVDVLLKCCKKMMELVPKKAMQ